MDAVPDYLEWAWAVRMSQPVQAWQTATLPSDVQGARREVLKAYLQWRGGDCAAALDALALAEPALRSTHDLLWLARALNLRGVLALQLNQSSQALAFFQEQLQLATQISDLEMIGSAHNDIGVLLIWDDPERARLRYQLAFDLLRDGGAEHAAALGLATFNLSVAYHELGEAVRSQEMLTLAETTVLRAQAWPYWVGIVSQRALRLAEAGEIVGARETFARAWEQWSLLPLDSQQTLQFFQAKAEMLSGDAQGALALLHDLQPWIETRQDMLDDYLNVYAQTYAKAGELQQAYEMMRHAFAAVTARHHQEQHLQLKALETVHRVDEVQRLNAALQQQTELLRRTSAELRHVSLTDELTGVHNRRHFLEWGEHQLSSGASLALAFVDVDHFKSINDTAGHEVGDQVMRELAQQLQVHSAHNFIARLGGDEFVVARLDDTPEALARDMEALRRACAVYAWSTGDHPVQLSIGVTQVRGNLTDGLRQADHAMYNAKRRGRNTVYVNEEGTDQVVQQLREADPD